MAELSGPRGLERHGMNRMPCLYYRPRTAYKGDISLFLGVVAERSEVTNACDKAAYLYGTRSNRGLPPITAQLNPDSFIRIDSRSTTDTGASPIHMMELVRLCAIQVF